MSLRSNEKPYLVGVQFQKSIEDLNELTPERATCSCDKNQQMSCFDRCQLTTDEGIGSMSVVLRLAALRAAGFQLLIFMFG